MPNGTGQHDADALESGYQRSHRVYETVGMFATTVASVWFVARIVACPPLSGWWTPLAALVGLLAADFVSGFVHWAFDTWGRIDTPVLGKLAIRTFRHHHVDQKAITRHDFIETNGHNFGLCLPVAVLGIWNIRPAEATLFGVFVGMALSFMIFFVCVTSQIHKWAHMDTPPRVVQLLQKARLVLSPDHHAGHHTAPYQRNYCITVGWMNGPLRAVRFFETLERIITAVTGAVPREDDLGKDAAVALAREIEMQCEDQANEALATRD